MSFGRSLPSRCSLGDEFLPLGHHTRGALIDTLKAIQDGSVRTA